MPTHADASPSYALKRLALDLHLLILFIVFVSLISQTGASAAGKGVARSDDSFDLGAVELRGCGPLACVLQMSDVLAHIGALPGQGLTVVIMEGELRIVVCVVVKQWSKGQIRYAARRACCTQGRRTSLLNPAAPMTKCVLQPVPPCSGQ